MLLVVSTSEVSWMHLASLSKVIACIMSFVLRNGIVLVLFLERSTHDISGQDLRVRDYMYTVLVPREYNT